MALFNPKTNALVAGRKHLFFRLNQVLSKENRPLIWIHCASLGEFQQGKPILEGITNMLPNHAIMLTFFSPSGYEACKHYQKADFIFYIPWDTRVNAKKFLTLVNPVLVIFIKYEFWFNFMRVLHTKSIPVVLASAVFRKNQLFFKHYGSFYRRMLFWIDRFFVQNKESEKLLQTLGITQIEVVGDTRVDRVLHLLNEPKEMPSIKKFQGHKELFIVGSCWSEDIELLIPFINTLNISTKIIIAPHEAGNMSFIKDIEKRFAIKSLRYSEIENHNLNDYRMLIIDNIGMLSHLYRYAKFTYVGGGLGRGLHNILEPACYGIPIFFGNRKYKKFHEAHMLIRAGGAFSVGNGNDLIHYYNQIIRQEENYKKACEAARSYVVSHGGATKKIVTYCHQLITAS